MNAFNNTLSEIQLNEMRNLYIAGTPINVIAKEFNVSRQAVFYHSKKVEGKRKKTWQQLRDERVIAEEKLEKDRIELQKLKKEKLEINSNLTDEEKEYVKRIDNQVAVIDSLLENVGGMIIKKPSEYAALVTLKEKLLYSKNSKDEVFIIGAPPPVKK